MNDDLPLTGSGPADPYAVKQFWTQVVGAADRVGRLDKIPARPARNLREKSAAWAQRHAISQRTYGWSNPNYDKIDWSR